MKPLLALLWLLPAFAMGADLLRPVPLKHRTADEVAALLRPLAPPEVTVIASEGQLLLRGEAAQVEEFAKVIETVDVARRSLRIRVRQGGTAESEPDQPAFRGYRTRDRDLPEMTRQIETVAGEWAHIDLSRSFPIVQQSMNVGPQGIAAWQETEYQEVSSGFDVLPRIAGDKVELDIRVYHGDQAREGGGIIERSQVKATLQGRVGQWIDLGTTLEPVREEASVTHYSTQSREQRQHRVQIRVEIIP